MKNEWCSNFWSCLWLIFIVIVSDIKKKETAQWIHFIVKHTIVSISDFQKQGLTQRLPLVSMGFGSGTGLTAYFSNN